MQNLQATPASAEPELGPTLTRMLRSPLSALRASIESIAADYRDEDPRGAALHGALEQVSRMARDVQALVDWAAPRPLQPLRCSADELLHAALRGCTYEQIARLSVARGSEPFALVVDGPLLATSLAHLLETAFAAGGDCVLLQARMEGADAVFAIVQGGVHAFDLASRAGEPQTTALGLGLALARREIERMDGSLSIERTPRGCTCALVRIPGSATPSAPRSPMPLTAPLRRQSPR